MKKVKILGAREKKTGEAFVLSSEHPKVKLKSLKEETFKIQIFPYSTPGLGVCDKGFEAVVLEVLTDLSEEEYNNLSPISGHYFIFRHKKVELLRVLSLEEAILDELDYFKKDNELAKNYSLYRCGLNGDLKDLYFKQLENYNEKGKQIKSSSFSLNKKTIGMLKGILAFLDGRIAGLYNIEFKALNKDDLYKTAEELIKDLEGLSLSNEEIAKFLNNAFFDYYNKHLKNDLFNYFLNNEILEIALKDKRSQGVYFYLLDNHDIIKKLNLDADLIMMNVFDEVYFDKEEDTQVLDFLKKGKIKTVEDYINLYEEEENRLIKEYDELYGDDDDFCCCCDDDDDFCYCDDYDDYDIFDFLYYQQEMEEDDLLEQFESISFLFPYIGNKSYNFLKCIGIHPIYLDYIKSFKK